MHEKDELNAGDQLSIEEAVRLLHAYTAEHLPEIDDRKEEELVAIIRTYDTYVRPNFLAWMRSALREVKSSEAVAACADNIACEEQEDHPAMLTAFTAQLSIYPIREVNEEPIIKVVEDLNGHTRSGLQLLLMMAGMENASCAFIPWMEKAADRLGMLDRTYLVKHGVADIAHAKEFVRASQAELKLLEEQDNLDSNKRYQSLEHVGAFFREIFNVRIKDKDS